MAILVVLAGLLTPALLHVLQKAKVSRALSNADTFRSAVQYVAVDEYVAMNAYSSGHETTYEPITNRPSYSSISP